jgi:hypothetical protein
MPLSAGLLDAQMFRDMRVAEPPHHRCEVGDASGIEEQSVHLSRAAIERRIYHPNGEISSTKIGIRIACAHIDRMSKVRGQQKNEPKVRSYHNVLRRRS